MVYSHQSDEFRAPG